MAEPVWRSTCHLNNLSVSESLSGAAGAICEVVLAPLRAGGDEERLWLPVPDLARLN